MQLTPTPLPTALTLLLVSEARVSALVRPAFGLAAPEEGLAEGQPEGSGDNDGGGDGNNSGSSRNERGQRRAIRVRYDLDNTRSLLEQVGWVLDKWDAIPARRKEMVEVRELAAVFGAGTVVFNCVENGLRELARLYEMEALVKGAMERAEDGCEVDKNKDVVRWLRHDVTGELWEMMRGLKDLATAVWCVMTILESPSDDDAATSRENLRAAVASILGKENELSREIKRLYPEAEIGLGRLDQTDAVSVSVSDESSIGQNTPRTSIDYRPRPSSGSETIIFLDDSESDDSDSEDGLPTPTSSEFPFPDTAMEGRLATLADISSPDDVLIPVAESPDPATPTPNNITPNLTLLQSSQRDSASLKVITVSTTGVDISPLPEDLDASSQPTANTALSADAVFQLPEITDKVVLDFFHRALEVSRFAAHFPNRRNTLAGVAGHQPSQQKLENLSPLQMRELSTDLYDELVRRNVEDQNKGKRSIAERKRFVEPQGLDIKRLYARGKLARMSDGQLAGFMAVVLGELERRCQAWPGALQSSVRESFFHGSARLSAVGGDQWSVEAVPEALEGQMFGSAILDKEALKRIENRKRFMKAK